ncbi:hypothetical protein P9J64_17000 [Deltaproteobacteria bacterium IMCC39524]|nr:hypothetical protein [Deltaproteobacteria bacterium IMCC39524]
MDEPIYEVTYKEKPEYLYAFIRSLHEERHEALSVWTRIAKECRNRGYWKLVIEEDIGSQFSTIEMFQFAAKLPEIGFIGIKLAFIDRQAGDHDLNLFGEDVAVNRGLFGKIFKDIGEAEKWLLAS